MWGARPALLSCLNLNPEFLLEEPPPRRAGLGLPRPRKSEREEDGPASPSTPRGAGCGPEARRADVRAQNVRPASMRRLQGQHRVSAPGAQAGAGGRRNVGVRGTLAR